MKRQQPPTVLATDLDGTLIPLEDHDQNRRDLAVLVDRLQDDDVALVFVTGRHYQSVIDAIEQFQLPMPGWIICDVGTSIYQFTDNGFQLAEPYQLHQEEIVAAMPIDLLRENIAAVRGLRLQEPVKQGRFKLSFYADAADLDLLVAKVQNRLHATAAPYSIIHSIDPFNGDGLIDLLPTAVSKAHAIAWWAKHLGLSDDAIVFAGDSGNDLAALTAGYRAIIVGNADQELVQRASQAHRNANHIERLFVASQPATSGVLEGWCYFQNGLPIDQAD